MKNTFGIGLLFMLTGCAFAIPGIPNIPKVKDIEVIIDDIAPIKEIPSLSDTFPKPSLESIDSNVSIPLLKKDGIYPTTTE
tara:strand:+ start:9547 stop:9789 length:243 start_codon:yes stop_codon:yes gene_type:complete